MNNDDTQPGLTQDADGVISIGPAASKASQKRAEKEAFENAEKVVGEINEETSVEKAEE